jgi:hypothetical protein
LYWHYTFRCCKITSNFILATSNILEQHISISNLNNNNFTTETSNILEQYIYTRSINYSNFTILSSNMIMNHLKQWIYCKQDVDEFDNALNTHIYSSNILEEIRFITSGCPAYFGNNDNSIAKIAENGNLMVYYTYFPQFPTVLPEWYVVMDTIRDNCAFQSQTNSVIVGIQTEINTISATLSPISVAYPKIINDIVIS